ncbi:hypothetical protein BU17DRAFT_60122 [Hysterangium stoloniferum]|nr:hypothetical protein BU17DRAFT_60122 [Hysterangium stoloniferum]
MGPENNEYETFKEFDAQYKRNITSNRMGFDPDTKLKNLKEGFGVVGHNNQTRTLLPAMKCGMNIKKWSNETPADFNTNNAGQIAVVFVLAQNTREDKGSLGAIDTELLRVMAGRLKILVRMTFARVKEHNGIMSNEGADQLAEKAYKGIASMINLEIPKYFRLGSQAAQRDTIKSRKPDDQAKYRESISKKGPIGRRLDWKNPNSEYGKRQDLNILVRILGTSYGLCIIHAGYEGGGLNIQGCDDKIECRSPLCIENPRNTSCLNGKPQDREKCQLVEHA